MKNKNKIRLWLIPIAGLIYLSWSLIDPENRWIGMNKYTLYGLIIQILSILTLPIIIKL